ncbi:unnamed protein product [Rotaria sp. Silwood1]|nr:unnamed protein product [Rotaria sp. Silwood1]CAF3697165.1 unnamed protein product [Rotaria sp. Silwood1]CAF3707549.1 unnamed protein product [Rotaria sp. Silwood1]CAF3720707.1 unnamed protein product [Rotaria sp. Silwood1]CAF4832599.1 unnamed protein product [Rotaria sp. Silwood1]
MVSGIHKLLTGSITTVILLFEASIVHDNRSSYHVCEINKLDVIICCFSSMNTICCSEAVISIDTWSSGLIFLLYPFNNVVIKVCSASCEAGNVPPWQK